MSYPVGPAQIRVMTYNVHSCRGLDGRVDPKRISKVIEEYDPDLVALQELDVNRRNSGQIDQPSTIANQLQMRYHFQPAIAFQGEHYGIAIFSRHPFEIVKAGHLSWGLKNENHFASIPVLRYFFEPREIIWTKIKLKNKDLHFFNTHLGLRAKEREAQIKNILSDDWLGAVQPNEPLIFCGDFNATPKSKVYQLVENEFREVKSKINDGGLRKTFFSHLPLFALDHIFYKGNIELESVEVPSTQLTRMASDHLPVIAEFTL